MDGIGFGLERYDQLGRYRTHDEGEASCVIAGKGDLAGIGTFHGPAELAQLAIESGLLNGCVATQLYRFAIGRSELNEADEHAVEQIVTQIGNGEFRFDELVLELVSQPEFSLRRQEPDGKDLP